jgi:hypothetical protein
VVPPCSSTPSSPRPSGHSPRSFASMLGMAPVMAG